MIPFTVLFGLSMAMVDVFVLSLLKMRYNKTITTDWVFIIAFLIYGFQTVIFYKSLSYGNLTNMNLLWDLSSDILVTIVGIYFFKEAVTTLQRVGILLGMISIYLLK